MAAAKWARDFNFRGFFQLSITVRTDGFTAAGNNVESFIIKKTYRAFWESCIVTSDWISRGKLDRKSVV